MLVYQRVYIYIYGFMTCEVGGFKCYCFGIPLYSWEDEPRLIFLSTVQHSSIKSSSEANIVSEWPGRANQGMEY